MRSLEEFQQFRAEVLAPLLIPIREAARRGRSLIWSTFAFTLLASSVAWLVTLVATERDMERALIVGGICLALGVVAMFAEYSYMASNRKAAFKHMVVAKIAEFIDPELHYRPEGMVPEVLFSSSGIFTEHVDRYSGEDLVRGRYSGVELAFSEIHAEYKTTTIDGRGRTQTHWHTIFKGVFMIADFNKDFNTHTVVVPDSAESVFGSYIGNMLQKWNFSRSGSLVKLEDPEFEKVFAVYGEDQVEARYILTPALMSRIMSLRAKSGASLALSFLGSKVFLCISKSRNLFEVGYALESPERLDGIFADMAAFAGIVDDLNLTTRIWTKE